MPRAQMVRFAQLRRQGSATLTERRLMLEQHQHSLEQHMQELEQHMAALQQKIARLKEREAERDDGLMMSFNKLSGISEQPAKADNEI